MQDVNPAIESWVTLIFNLIMSRIRVAEPCWIDVRIGYTVQSPTSVTFGAILSSMEKPLGWQLDLGATQNLFWMESIG